MIDEVKAKRALAAPAAQALAPWRVPENEAGRLANYHAPAWVFLTGLKIDLSSTVPRGCFTSGFSARTWVPFASAVPKLSSRSARSGHACNMPS